MKVEIKGIRELVRTFERMSVEKKKQIYSETFASALEIQKNAKENLTALSAIDTGHLRQSIIIEMEEKGSGVTAEIGPTAKYAPYVEYGTAPHFPPPSELELWAKRHGFMSSWPICRAIARRGLRARPFLFPACEVVIDKYLRKISEILER